MNRNFLKLLGEKMFQGLQSFFLVDEARKLKRAVAKNWKKATAFDFKLSPK